MKTEAAAIVTIKRAAEMTPGGRKRIAAWLRRQAGFLERYHKELSPRFTARYIYEK